MIVSFVFFFQAEDGIRDWSVTGVQTCALPIYVAGSIDLKGLDVLEVGCGRGGGASYIMRYLKPKSMTGVDIAEKAIAFCKRYHTVEGLSFRYGDAESLPFDNNTFDVIVNIESSQCYGSIPRF